MTYDQLLKIYETQQLAANAIGVSKQFVSKYRRKEFPQWAQVRWEVASSGKLLADLPNELRSPRRKQWIAA